MQTASKGLGTKVKYRAFIAHCGFPHNKKNLVSEAAMKRFLLSLAVFATLLFAQSAWAACGTGSGTCFWVAAGSSNNWSATTTSHWSATSGGAAGQTLAAGDAVVFDANSGTGTSNIDTSISISSFDASASTAVTLTHGAATVTVTGTAITFNSTIIYQGVNVARVWSANPTGTNTLTITSAGQRFGALIINGATGATVTLADALRVDVQPFSALFTLTQGIFNDNSQSVTVAAFNSSNSNTRTLTMGTGNTWTVTGDDNTAGNGSAWLMSTTTGLTFNKGTATIAFNSTSTANKTFAAGNPSGGYPTVTFGALSNGPRWNILGGPTIATLNITAPNYIAFGGGTTTTVTNAFNFVGTASNPILLFDNTGLNFTAATISVASGSPSGAFVSLLGITCAGGATFAFTNSFDIGGNTNCGIVAPVTGGGGRIIGG